MGVAAVTFVVIFLLIASGGLILFYREAMIQRIAQVVTPREEQSKAHLTLQQTGAAIGGIVQKFETVIPRSKEETSVVQQRLIRAGYRRESAISYFYGAKVLVPLILCIVAYATGVIHYSPFFICIVALGLGFVLPDFWLGNRISKRQDNIRRGLPDVLDMLVICVEAGLSLDQATARTVQELEVAHPDICDELNLVVLEQRAGCPRSDAWKHFAERSNVESVRNLVSVLIQTEKFGTSIAKTLRVHSDTLRTQRRQKIEELAAKTTVKLVFPLVLFIFPSLFLVTLGPAAITIAEEMKRLFH